MKTTFKVGDLVEMVDPTLSHIREDLGKGALTTVAATPYPDYISLNHPKHKSVTIMCLAFRVRHATQKFVQGELF